MMLTLSKVAENPHILTKAVMTVSNEKLVVRPLEDSDVNELREFLQDLSVETRRFSTFSGYDLEMARELCDAIARDDKLRFVLETTSQRIIGLLEFSFDIIDTDIARYNLYKIVLNPDTDCRFGPTLVDDYQNKGIGSLIMPFIIDVASQFGQNRIILWGGVLSDNTCAIRFYEKNGFKMLGRFKTQDDAEAIDMILEL